MKLLIILKYIFVFNKRRAIALWAHNSRAVAAALACDGQTEVDELICLAGYAKTASAGQSIVEIGSFRGRSSVAMALSCITDVQVFSVDPYMMTSDCQGIHREYSGTDREICQLNLILSGALRKTRNIHLSSQDAAKCWGAGPRIGLIFIDGSHELVDVRNDFESWLPHIAIGGIICFHDSTDPKWGVCKLMEDLKSRADLEFVKLVNAISVFRVRGRIEE